MHVESKRTNELQGGLNKLQRERLPDRLKHHRRHSQSAARAARRSDPVNNSGDRLRQTVQFKESRDEETISDSETTSTETFQEQSGGSQPPIQLAMPLPEVVQRAQQGLMSLALYAFLQVAEQMMAWDVAQLVGPKNQAQQGRQNFRWGSQMGYCVVGGQKVPLEKPRVRDKRQREVALGSYELLQQASLMDDAVWHKVMHGLTMRRYSEVVRELEQAYGIEKTTVSEHFIEASRLRVES